MSNTLPFDPFTTEGLITIPGIEQDLSQIWHGFQISTNSQPELLRLAEPLDVKLVPLQSTLLRLAIDDVPLLAIKPSPPSSPTTPDAIDDENQRGPLGSVEEEDLWAHVDIDKAEQTLKLTSWDHFLDPNHKPSRSAYISEISPLAVNTLSHKPSDDGTRTSNLTCAKENLLGNALFDLALGVSSSFFEWDGKVEEYVSTHAGFAVSGLSQAVVDQLVNEFLAAGTKFRRLTSFQQKNARKKPSFVATAGMVHDTLIMVERYAQEKRRQVVSFVQLRDVFTQPFELITLLYQLTEVYNQTEDVGQQYQQILKLADNASNIHLGADTLVPKLIHRIFQPALQGVSHAIGLSAVDVNMSQLEVKGLEQILPQQTSALLNSTQACLELLEQIAPQGVLELRQLARNEKIDLCYTWSQIAKRQEDAGTYERLAQQLPSHEAAILKSDVADRSEIPSQTEYDQISNDDAFEFKIDLFDKPAKELRNNPSYGDNDMQDAVLSFLAQEATEYSWTQLSCRQALELSLLPMVTAQHRILSYMALQSLFIGNRLQLHLESLQQFHLLNNGPFIARLSTALFDANQSSGEGKRSTDLASGLRLQNRHTWPPASSELRLVLMGILQESLSNVKDEDVVTATSFAIRDLPDEELERCRDLNSIYALDFLRLYYKAPNAILESVITTKTLKRYDRVFMYLLRLLRLKDLSQYFVRQTCARTQSERYSSIERRLRREIHQFISALANYSQNIAIQTHWHKFASKLQAIRERLEENDYEGTLALANSLDHLREMHEQTLKDISSALMLSKKQTKARTIIEEIFDLILKYAATATAQPSDEKSSEHNKTSPLALIKVHKTLTFKVKALLDNLALEMRNGNNTEDSESQTAAQLLLALDYTGYYEKFRS